MPEALRLENQLCFALYAASRAMVQSYQPFLGPLGITYPQYLVMLVLWEGGSPMVKELGERLDLDSGTLTPLLKRLEALGLVVRDRQQSDQRQVRIRLTDSGKILRRKAARIPGALLCRYGAEEIGELVELREAVSRLRDKVRAEDPE